MKNSFSSKNSNCINMDLTIEKNFKTTFCNTLVYLILVAALTFVATSSFAAMDPTKVGNGDAGGDLENMEKVTSGILIQTRDKALEQIKKQSPQNIQGLSKLIPELEKAEIYLGSSNVSPILKTDNQTDISNDGRFVYARTFAEPHTPVRFFPAALMLSEQQLINLHIHEALHRALPESVRENESVVSELTLALTSADSSADRTQAIMEKALKPSEPVRPMMNSGSANMYGQPMALGLNSSIYQMEPPQTERLKNPSEFKYSYQVFDIETKDKDFFPIRGMHLLESNLYPFGENSSVRGIGLKFSYVNLEDKSVMGPMMISANTLFTTWRGFEVEGFAQGSLFSLSNDELKNLPKTRDTMTVGLSMKREDKNFYTENFISITPGNEKTFTVGNVKYNERYSSILDTRIEGGFKKDHFSLGVMGDFLLTEGTEVSSEDQIFSVPKERIRVFKFGPKMTYQYDQLKISVYSQHLVDKTAGYDLTDFANVMGLGAGQSVFGAGLSFTY